MSRYGMDKNKNDRMRSWVSASKGSKLLWTKGLNCFSSPHLIILDPLLFDAYLNSINFISHAFSVPSRKLFHTTFISSNQRFAKLSHAGRQAWQNPIVLTAIARGLEKNCMTQNFTSLSLRTIFLFQLFDMHSRFRKGRGGFMSWSRPERFRPYTFQNSL